MKRDSDSQPTSLQISSLLARATRLRTERRYRERHRRFFVEGVRNFLRAVECGHTIEAVLVSDILLTSSISRRLVHQLRDDGIPTVKISPREFRSVSIAERASGIAAIVRQRVRRLGDVDATSGTCWIVVRRKRAPFNHYPAC